MLEGVALCMLRLTNMHLNMHELERIAHAVVVTLKQAVLSNFRWLLT